MSSPIQLAVDPFGVFALVLTPTRELASQIVDQFRAVGKPIGLKVYCVIGGTDSVREHLFNDTLLLYYEMILNISVND